MLIGVDIGTQGTKAALFTEEGECLARAFRPSKLHQPKAGTTEEDPEDQVSSVCHTIHACLRKVKGVSVSGIGIDGQMAGVIGVGHDGKHVTPYDSWLDTRCTSYVQEMQRRAGPRVLRKTGCPPSINHGPKKLWWMHRRKKAYRAIKAFVQPGAYAAMRLCGLAGHEAFIDTTYLHFSGFADNRAARWDAALCDCFGMDIDKLPKIVDPQTIVGELTSAMARRCGLRAGVPVVAGCGDTAASFLACGATSPGICVDVAGTASVFAATTASFRADTRTMTLGCGRSAVPGLWHPYAYINGGGMNLEWFRGQIAGRDGSACPDFEKLDALAARSKPDDAQPLFVPHLGGRAYPSQPELRGAWTGLSWNHSAADLYRAVLESVALEYCLYKRTVRQLYRNTPLTEVRITGGGERSGLWNRIKADALQIPVRRIEQNEGAPMGAALLAGFGVGILPNLRSAAKRWITAGRRLRPRAAAAPLYARRLARYEALLQRLDGA